MNDSEPVNNIYPAFISAVALVACVAMVAVIILIPTSRLIDSLNDSVIADLRLRYARIIAHGLFVLFVTISIFSTIWFFIPLVSTIGDQLSTNQSTNHETS